MSPKKRNKENKGLPARWRLRSGTYSYMVPPGQESRWNGKKEFRLGRTLSEAYKTWAERMDSTSDAQNFSQLCERYELEHLPETSSSNMDQGQIAIRRLKPVFGEMSYKDIEPSHAYRYYDLQKKQSSEYSAKADVGHLKTMLTCAVKWGLMNNNPLLRNVTIKISEKKKKESKARYLHDWEVEQMLTMTGLGRGTQIIQPYIKLKLITGLRRIDLLLLKVSNFKEDGLHVEPRKTSKTSGVKLIFKWNDALRDVFEEIKRLPPRRIGDAYLFTTRRGDSYVNAQGQARSFNSIWQRFVAKALEETEVELKFMEKDLRAKVGSDEVSDELASKKLGHSNIETTRKHYRLLPEIIELSNSN